MKNILLFAIAMVSCQVVMAGSRLTASLDNKPLIAVHSGTEIQMSKATTLKAGLHVLQNGHHFLVPVNDNGLGQFPAEYNRQLPACTVSLEKPTVVVAPLKVANVYIFESSPQEIIVKTSGGFEIICSAQAIDKDPVTFLVKDFNQVVSALFNL